MGWAPILMTFASDSIVALQGASDAPLSPELRPGPPGNKDYGLLEGH